MSRLDRAPVRIPRGSLAASKPKRGPPGALELRAQSFAPYLFSPRAMPCWRCSLREMEPALARGPFPKGNLGNNSDTIPQGHADRPRVSTDPCGCGLTN